MQLNTERLVLRDITIEDKQAIFDYRSDAEANKFQSWSYSIATSCFYLSSYQ
ncbi:hypothetical protein QWZ06_05860 [Chryseobacterium tructae]|uniref:GNAT family N-acetyltransferase n=1 Tax=Chryseobacterium tructae TaxID=1037380 RepID=UPI0025B5A910|nr:hypothetical protein [Chryseobacterium tructae]MDN3691808.1 hypothetical protein [Chryseobacterium tructae]